jgi:hypothetical protein
MSHDTGDGEERKYTQLWAYRDTHSPCGTDPVQGRAMKTHSRLIILIDLHVNASLLHHGDHQLLLEGFTLLCGGLCAGLGARLDCEHLELLVPLVRTVSLLDLLELQRSGLALSPPSEGNPLISSRRPPLEEEPASTLVGVR